MIYHRGASLSKQPTADVVFCHWHTAGLLLYKPNLIMRYQRKVLQTACSDIFPAKAATMATHGYTKLHGEIISWISGVYECLFMHSPYLKQFQPGAIICTVYKQPAVDGRSVAAETNKK